MKQYPQAKNVKELGDLLIKKEISLNEFVKQMERMFPKRISILPKKNNN